MAHSPFESNTQVKRKIEPADGLSLWFAEVPEGGVTENTYLSAVISGEESEFLVEEHFHPKSTEYFTILAGEMHFTLNGVEHVVRKEDGVFVIPRGVVHTVRSPKGKHTEFKVRGDHDVVEERDFLIQMFTLVETNQFGLLKRYTCFYRSGNFVPKFSYVPKTFGSILVWLLGGVFGTFLGLGKADLKKD